MRVCERFIEKENFLEGNFDREFHRHPSFHSDHVGWRRRSNEHYPLDGFSRLFSRTTFYFTKFLVSFGVEEMRKVFRKLGRVKDIFIPSMRDKFGKKFGFVRFLIVQDPISLESKLDSIWLGSYRLRANLPLFERGSKRRFIKDDQDCFVTIHKGGVVDGKKSFEKVVVDRSSFGPNRRNVIGSYQQNQCPNKNIVNQWRGLEFRVSEEDLSWLKGSYVGKLADLESLLSFKKHSSWKGLFL